jgi:hypothetical protein
MNEVCEVLGGGSGSYRFECEGEERLELGRGGMNESVDLVVVADFEL